MSASC